MKLISMAGFFFNVTRLIDDNLFIKKLRFYQFLSRKKEKKTRLLVKNTCFYVKQTLPLRRHFKNYISMKTNYLLPTYFRKIGWILFFPTFVMDLICLSSNSDWNNWLKIPVFSLFQREIITDSVFDEIGMIGLTLSLLFICLAKEKGEDECIAAIRSQALIWATIVSYALIILGTLLIYGMPFLTFMFIAPFILLLLFMIKYRIEIYKFRRNSND